MTCLCWIFGYMRLEIWRKISLQTDVFAQHYTLVAMHTTIGLDSGDVHPSQSFSMLLEKLGPTK